MFQVNAITRLIEIPNSVTIKLEKNGIAISGPLGVLFQSIDSTHIQVGVEANQLFVKAINSTKYAKSIVGTLKALISNMIKGVTEGFEKKLLIV
ncbi:50S ribosomal protein L6, partial [Nitrosomonas sp.]|uniref:50S ribosomal protein L6 n=1 Tax=Nitrosomonas sp. TaxID=42353 RepID=UPI0025D1BD28